MHNSFYEFLKQLYTYNDKPLNFGMTLLFDFMYILLTFIFGLMYNKTEGTNYNIINYNFLALSILRLIGVLYYIAKHGTLLGRNCIYYLICIPIKTVAELYEICVIYTLIENEFPEKNMSSKSKAVLGIFILLNLIKITFHMIILIIYVLFPCNRVNLLNFLYQYNRTYREPIEELHEQLYVNNPVLIIMRKSTINDTHEICSICLSNYSLDEDLGVLSCTHIYHHQCISIWINKSTTCPICRTNVTVIT